MNAEEPGVWLDEIKLDVPTVPLQHMNHDLGRHVVRAAAVVSAAA